MSTYYIPCPTPRSAVYTRSPSAHTIQHESTTRHEEQLTLDVESSAYIFPSPSSAPPSPSSSSSFSAPTDLTGHFTVTSRPGRREHSLSPRAGSARSASRSPRGNAAANSSDNEWFVNIAAGLDSHRAIRSPLVELGDWTAISEEGIADPHCTWEIESNHERPSPSPSRWDVAVNSRRAWPLHLAHRPPAARTFPSSTAPDHIRTRTQLNTSTDSLASAARASHTTVQAPHPRIHIPLLSFFASLLALDLDDPALHALTDSTADSILFPGQNHLLGPPNPVQCEQEGSDDELAEDIGSQALKQKSHILGAHSLAEGSFRSLKEGLDIACNPSFSVTNPFPMPSLGGLIGLCRLVGGVWVKGEKAWEEVRTMRF